MNDCHLALFFEPNIARYINNFFLIFRYFKKAKLLAFQVAFDSLLCLF